VAVLGIKMKAKTNLVNNYLHEGQCRLVGGLLRRGEAGRGEGCAIP